MGRDKKKCMILIREEYRNADWIIQLSVYQL